eukprot:TRINITY_DN1544_c0_g1_i1.p1 TRINITY_DN1544_c0_g1~~TRINITY_DN1544_c0_g1_i1.p1  ORF type:complete len:178 (-),score=33.46 TRINITY_DN1544_c0_g1_i1:26-538(-)
MNVLTQRLCLSTSHRITFTKQRRSIQNTISRSYRSTSHLSCDKEPIIMIEKELTQQDIERMQRRQKKWDLLEYDYNKPKHSKKKNNRRSSHHHSGTGAGRQGDFGDDFFGGQVGRKKVRRGDARGVRGRQERGTGKGGQGRGGRGQKRDDPLDYVVDKRNRNDRIERDFD